MAPPHPNMAGWTASGWPSPTPWNTRGGPTAAPRARTTSVGVSITRSRPRASASAPAPARSRVSRASPITRRFWSNMMWWVTPNERSGCASTAQTAGVDLESIHAAGGVDDVLLRVLLRTAVPAGQRHPRLLAARERARAERHHDDRECQPRLRVQIRMGTVARSLAVAGLFAIGATPRLAAAGPVRRHGWNAGDGGADARQYRRIHRGDLVRRVFRRHPGQRHRCLPHRDR